MTFISLLAIPYKLSGCLTCNRLDMLPGAFKLHMKKSLLMIYIQEYDYTETTVT